MPPFTQYLFPTFYELPASADSVPASSSSPDARPAIPDDEEYFLVAQVKENMTITKPTLILTDRTGVDFALLFEDAVDLKARGIRKGHTLAIRRARRTDREEGKKAIVRVEGGHSGDVMAIPGTLEQVFELGMLLDSNLLGAKCSACGAEGDALMKCTGCGTAAYCNKGCQVKGWGEMGHKSNCKVLKGIKAIWK
ncbi:hypothetical protein F5Y15DRAFT_2260 [Xylariaceae sp. FL0016]|nr:hypothetical protein F5Y15DRAFT_2260 [Xylariaceae sp. FL0016]